MAGFHQHSSRAPLDAFSPGDLISSDRFIPERHRAYTQGASRLRPADAAYLEHLALKLAALGLLEPAAAASAAATAVAAAVVDSTSFTPQCFEGFMPEAEFRPEAVLEERKPVSYDRLSPRGCPVLDRSALLGFFRGRDGYGTGSGPFYPTSMRKTLPSELEDPYQRITLTHRRQAAARSRAVPNSVSVSRRACGGTGVFLPRVNNGDNYMGGYGVKKTRGEEGPAVLLQPPRTSRAVMANEGMSCQAPAEPNLPADWTY